MGRPIKKKFFGNLNTGSGSTSADNGIGGEGVASVVLNAKGNYTTRPTFTFSAPQISRGVRATGTITSEASTAAPDGTLLNGINYVVGDLITFAGVTGTVGRVATVGSGQGEIQTIDFAGTGTNRGSFTTLPTNKTTLAVTVVGNTAGGSGSTGTGQTVAITFRASEVVITEKGSGYTSAPTSTPTQSVTFTSVALTSTQQNAISFTSFLTTGSNAVTGGDIIKQESTRRYLVQNSEGIGQCKLVASGTLEEGQMNIIATDYGGATYFVTKLTAHKANLVNRTNTSTALVSIPTGGTAASGWTLGAATGTIVTIASV
jgi:hypothetical protein